MDEVETSEAVCIYDLFHNYAEWTREDATQDGQPVADEYAVEMETGSLLPTGVRQLLWDLNLLEGIPDELINAYVREIMLRADQDRDGKLSVEEFVVWFLSEVAALLPFKRNGATTLSCAPLYNRLVYYMLAGRGPGVRRKVSGLQVGQLMQLCADVGIIDQAETVERNALQIAGTYASCDRAVVGVEAGTRLQMAQVVHALSFVAGHLHVSLETLLYRIVSDGFDPVALYQRPTNDTMRTLNRVEVTKLLLESELEHPLKKSLYECEICGRTHEHWINGDAAALKAHFQANGMPWVPHFSIVNGRNIRAVFHRYNVKYNKGVMPSPSPAPQDGSDAAADDLDAQVQQVAKRRSTHAEQLKYEPQPSLSQWKVGSWPLRRGSTSPTHSTPSNKACCCQVQTLSLMELQTFMRLVQENRTLRKNLKSAQGNITNSRIEAAFTTAASMEGVYSKGPTMGVHDRPMTRPQADELRTYSAATVSQPVAPPGGQDCSRANSPNPGASSGGGSASSPAARAAEPGSGVQPTSSSARGRTRHHWQGGVAGVPSPIIFAAPEPVTCQYVHRTPVPTLTFPGFLEALRLLAEDMVGHPQILASVELALWTILHDVAVLQCPLPINQKWVQAV